MHTLNRQQISIVQNTENMPQCVLADMFLHGSKLFALPFTYPYFFLPIILVELISSFMSGNLATELFCHFLNVINSLHI